MEQRSTDDKMLFIRADADTQRGTGHVMRCLALAQAWRQQHGAVTFIGRVDSAPLRARLAREGLRIVSVTGTSVRSPEAEVLPAQVPLPAECGRTWYVVDGYHFDLSHHRLLRQAGFNVLVIDDQAHLPAYEADIILNQNPYAARLPYRCNPDAVLLLGTKYALLRQEFLHAVPPAKAPQSLCRRLLVTLGGSDPANVSLTVLTALQRLTRHHQADLDVKVVVGPANPHLASLQKASGNSPFRCALVAASDDMPGLMHWADLAISAAGTTCWELAYLGVPFATIVVADNQEQVAQELAATGVAVHCGQAQELSSATLAEAIASLLADEHRRGSMVAAGRALVDGRGVARVLDMMTLADMRLRPVMDADKQLLFRWANDPVVRHNSFHTHAIGWQEHCGWFTAHMQDAASMMFIAYVDEDQPVGLVRFALQNHSATVSVSIAAEFRGRGVGSRVISKACQALFAAHPVTKIHAYIKPDNIASRKVFAKAGFMREPDVPYQGTTAVMMTIEREKTALLAN